MRRNQVATARGSNLTHVPILKHGMRPAAACLKIVTLDIARRSRNQSTSASVQLSVLSFSFSR